MATWLEARWTRGERRLLLQAFRASGKSSLTGLLAAWLLTRDPDMRILVLSAESTLSRKMARNIRTIIQTHPLTAPLIPKTARGEWAADKFTVHRSGALRDPSVWAAGLYGNITGARADVIICDDVEVPNTCESAEARASLRRRLAETEFILNPGGTMLYLGTPHCYETIYADAPRAELGESAVFLKDYARLTIPVLDGRGQSAWPERFSTEVVARQKKQVGPVKFAAQMMLQPARLEQSRLDVALLRRYDAPFLVREVQGRLYATLMDKKIVSCGAWWDPAFGRASGDASVLAVVFNDEEGNRYLHRALYITAQAGNAEDEARQQCRMVARTVRDLFVPAVAVETNGIGGFLPGILRAVLDEERTACAVVEKSSNRAKEARILEAFDAVMAARALFVHESVYATPFIREMGEWRPGLRGAADDGLDAAAGALSLKPARIRRRYAQGGKTWGAQAQTHEARTDFDV